MLPGFFKRKSDIDIVILIANLIGKLHSFDSGGIFDHAEAACLIKI